MKLDEVKEALVKLGQELPHKIAASLKLEEREINLDIIVRPLLVFGCLVFKDGKYHIYVQKPRDLEGDLVTDSQLARMEFFTFHEIGHMMHHSYNDKFRTEYKESLKDKGKNFERLRGHAEFVAGYLAWYCADIQHGRKNFSSRLELPLEFTPEFKKVTKSYFHDAQIGRQSTVARKLILE